GTTAYRSFHVMLEGLERERHGLEEEIRHCRRDPEARQRCCGLAIIECHWFRAHPSAPLVRSEDGAGHGEITHSAFRPGRSLFVGVRYPPGIGLGLPSQEKHNLAGYGNVVILVQASRRIGDPIADEHHGTRKPWRGCSA